MTPFRVNTVIIVNPKSSEVIGLMTFSEEEDAKLFMERYESGQTDSDIYRRVSNRHGSDGFDWIDEFGDPRSLEMHKKRGTYFVTIPYEDRYTERSVRDSNDFWDYRLRDRTHIAENTEPLETMQELNPYDSANMARLRTN